MYITYSEYMSVALVVQHAKSMRHSTFLSVAFPGYTVCFHVSHKRRYFREKLIEREMFALTSSATFV